VYSIAQLQHKEEEKKKAKAKMGFLQLLEAASMPVIQVLLISALGAFMATQYFNNFLSPDFRKSLNKVVFIVFTPSLVFASFARSVSLEDMISWWFMPVNVGLTFLIGGILGWILVKLLKPNLKVEGLIIASVSSGNMGNLPIVIIPAICDENGGPFGARDICHSNALICIFFYGTRRYLHMDLYFSNYKKPFIEI
jgi:predicted permease